MVKKMCMMMVFLLCIPSVSAFVVDDDFSVQVDVHENTMTTSDGITLAQESLEFQKLFINPNFPTERDMYLSTAQGVYLNRQYDANFFEHEALTELFPHGFTEVKFDGSYKSTGIMLAYDSEHLYVSYNRGDSWTEKTPEISEDILFANFGPKFSLNPQIYFITESGLYRMNESSGEIEQLVESVEPGAVKNFRYVPTQLVDNIFYVVNGDTLLKTEDYGDTWLEYQFPAAIRDFEIKQKTLTDGHLMVLTEENKVYYATDGMTFYELDIPEEISFIYAVDYIILTDLGFYVTYDNGEVWQKMDYDPDKITAVKDYDFALDGVSQSLYMINGNTLYRDPDNKEVFYEYMGGLEQPDTYALQGTATSVSLLEVSADQFPESYYVTDAMLIADGDLNDQTMDFYMTADGENWESVEPGVTHTFTYPGRDLRWKVEMSTVDPSVTPVLREVSVDYGMEEMEGCAGFTDIAFNDPYCPAIQYVKDQGIFSGYPDGTFGADLEINRAETVKVITEGFNYEMLEDDGTDLGFSDTELGAWYMGYLNTAQTAGIIEGYSDGTFRPADVVNYVEMMKIFLETADAELTETTEGEWYQKYVDFATANELTVYEDLNAGMKRADVAQLFYDWSMM
ncbi:hypothetical protein GF369_04160 [Candidatus Peregrinibacteria bacterium]|nr:hypothetical protein [Candidatus Peregrinibacteria bacterium]